MDNFFEWCCLMILCTVLSFVCFISLMLWVKQDPITSNIGVISGGLAYLFLRIARKLK